MNAFSSKSVVRIKTLSTEILSTVVTPPYPTRKRIPSTKMNLGIIFRKLRLAITRLAITHLKIAWQPQKAFAQEATWIHMGYVLGNQTQKVPYERNKVIGRENGRGWVSNILNFTTQKAMKYASAGFFKDLLRINRMIKHINLPEDTNVSWSGRKGKYLAFVYDSSQLYMSTPFLLPMYF